MLLRRALAPTRSWCCAPTPSTCKQIGFAQSQATIERRSPRTRASRACWWRCSSCASIRRRATRQGAAAQVNAIEQALEKVSNLSEDRVLRQLLALMQATLRTNHWRTGVGHAARPARAAASSASSSIRPRCRGCPSRGRCSRSSSTRRASRHPPARRQGRARRPALVRPAGGLPHRGAGPGEGADGEEHRHRAGRLEGRLRAEEGAAADRPRGLPEGRRRPATRTSCAACSTSPTTWSAARSCRRRTWCASTATIRTSWSPPTRARRPSPTTPTRISAEYGFWLGDAFASGGSVGYDHKKMGITARGAWESVKRHFREMGVDTQTQRLHRGRHRRHVGRRVRQRHAALAAHQAAWRRSTTATSSSTRSRTRPRRSPSASACSSCRARRGTTTTRR